MTVPCPCGSPATVRHGAKPRRHLTPSGDGIALATCEAARFLCRSCGRTFTTLPAHAVEDERRARDRIAELAFALGRAGAADATGLGGARVDGLLDRWQGDREGDVADAAPDFVLLDAVAMRGGTVVLVADVDRETLAGAPAGAEGLAVWLNRPGVVPPLDACVPVDAALAATVRTAVPGIRLMVAPSTVGRALRSALAAGLAALRRDPSMGRRNGFPGSARFLRALDGRVAACQGWPLEVMALLSAGRAARAVLDAPDGASGRRLWREFEMAAAVPGGGPLRRLMSTWQEAILAGLDNRFVDRMARAMARVRRAAASRRPTLLARDFRALVLLRDAERVGADAGGPGEPERTVGVGRPLAGLAELLEGRGSGPRIA